MGHIAHHNVGNMPVTSESQTKATLALQGFTQKKKNSQIAEIKSLIESNPREYMTPAGTQ
jgi:hypothetical protein